MSKLDNILSQTANDIALGTVTGEWKESNTKQAIKNLMLGLVGDPDKQELWAQDCEVYAKKLIKKIEDL